MSVNLKGPANHGGFSFNGTSFTPNEAGEITIPHEAVEAARSHGFVVASDQPDPEPTPEPTQEPTPAPTEEPTSEPTLEPTLEPTPNPTGEPSGQESGNAIPNPDFSKKNKKQIAEFAKEHLNLDIDTALNKDQMIAEVETAIANRNASASTAADNGAE